MLSVRSTGSKHGTGSDWLGLEWLPWPTGFMVLAGLAGFGSSLFLVCFALALGSAAYNFIYGSGSTAAVGYGYQSRTGTSPAGRGY